MIDFSPFVNNHLNTYQLSEFNFERKTILAAIENEIRESFNSLNQEETKKARFDLFKIADTLPEDYQEYITTINEKTQIIYGIRHLGLDPKMPFIDFQASTQFTT